MSGSKLHAEPHGVETEVHGEERELYLRDGRKLVVTEQGGDQLVEVRAASGMVEVRIQLTEQGPVLQMEAVRLQLKATEGVEIESKRVDIKGETVNVEAEQLVKVESKQGETHVIGRPIHLNRDLE
jgi:NADPH-dependent glutamate synthase beta subunit-like oxidoreductase